MIIEESVNQGSNSPAFLMDVFVSIKNYIDYKTSFVTTNSKIRGREALVVPTKSISLLENRFKRIVFTPLNSRVMLPNFGSMLYKLIDKNMDFVWKIKLKKYLYESFFNENLELWDREFDPKEIRIVDADAESGEVSVSVTFKNGMEIGFNV